MCTAAHRISPVLRGFLALSTLSLAACAGEVTSGPDFAPAAARTTTEPTVTSTLPNSASRDTTIDVQVIGTGFDQGSRVEFARGGVVDAKLHVNRTSYVKSTQLTASLTIAADAEVAKYDIYVTTSKGKKGIGTELFAVNPILTLPLSGGGEARDVNDAGLVVGQQGMAPNPTRPFVWSLEMGLRYLPIAPGTCFQTAGAVNNQGVILARNGCGATPPVRWVPDGAGNWTPQSLGAAPNGTLPDAVAINDLGWIVGAWLDPSTNVTHPYLWTEGSGWAPLQTPAAAPSCYIELINNSGQMVGGCEQPGGQGGLTYLWSSPSAAPVSLSLPMPAGHVKLGVLGINDAGVLVGYSITCNCSKQVQRALRWTPSAGGYALTDLGDLGGGEARAEAINGAGQIVGRSTTAGKVSHAFLYTPGAGMRDLGALGPQDSWAFELNSGTGAPLMIVGRSSVNAVSQAVRWVP
jgi:probable HAF family extracellular repeat protein